MPIVTICQEVMDAYAIVATVETAFLLDLAVMVSLLALVRQMKKLLKILKT